MPRKLECSNCGAPKEIPEHSYCRPCRKVYRDTHYKQNRKVYFEKAVCQRKRNKEVIDDLKRNPCKDCGHKYHPWQMTFDHLPGNTKIGGVSELRGRKGLRGLLAEIAKCELVCMNCHANRTHQRYLRVRSIGKATASHAV